MKVTSTHDKTLRNIVNSPFRDWSPKPKRDYPSTVPLIIINVGVPLISWQCLWVDAQFDGTGNGVSLHTSHIFLIILIKLIYLLKYNLLVSTTFYDTIYIYQNLSMETNKRYIMQFRSPSFHTLRYIQNQRDIGTSST